MFICFGYLLVSFDFTLKVALVINLYSIIFTIVIFYLHVHYLISLGVCVVSGTMDLSVHVKTHRQTDKQTALCLKLNVLLFPIPAS